MNSSTLKIIALLSMVIDHVGAVLFPEIIILRMVGRLAFPIYCFLLVEGFKNTSDYKKYLRRMLSFAFISEVPFDMAFYGAFPYNGHQNVFFTLSTGLIVIYFFEKYRTIKTYMGATALGLGVLAAEFLNFDYGYMGILMIFGFYAVGIIEEKNKKAIIILCIALINFTGVYVQAFAILALIPIYFYNGKRGINLKYVFYLIYPIHLAILAGIKYVEGMGTL